VASGDFVELEALQGSLVDPVRYGYKSEEVTGYTYTFVRSVCPLKPVAASIVHVEGSSNLPPETKVSGSGWLVLAQVS
jgi:hypothetical protein